jgi:hypothetical protein
LPFRARHTKPTKEWTLSPSGVSGQRQQHLMLSYF